MTVQSISLTELKQNLHAVINQAAYGGQRIILLSHGKERAALISIEDLHLLETLQQENEYGLPEPTTEFAARSRPGTRSCG